MKASLPLVAMALACLTAGCGPVASGVVATLDVAGGPPGIVHGGETVAFIVSAAGKPTARISATGGTPTRIALAPGDYTISGQYGNAGCSSTSVHVTSAWPSVELTCSIH